MDRKEMKVSLCLFLLLVALSAFGQQVATNNATVVPPLVSFSGTLTDINGKPLTSIVGVTFFLYNDQQAASSLWMETQNVTPDKNGRYSVQLGSTSSAGLPAGIFVAGEARWLGVQPQGQAEYPRVMLLSVPYALKAGDAQTIGGLPPSAFVMATAPQGAAASTAAPAGASSSSALPPSSPVTGTGTVNFVPLWDSTSDIISSVLFQSGSGATAKIGVNTTKPAATLDIKGSSTIRGLLSLPATGVATATKGAISQPVDLAASAFNSGTGAAVPQTFQWQAEPVHNNTSNASGSLNLLFGSGTGKPAETGLNIASNGQITFAPGQTFPGTGNGTITGVTAGIDLTGGGSTGNVTLNLDLTKVPVLSGGNSFTGNQTVNGNLSAIQLISTIAQGTSPLQVSSSTQVPNLNASFLDGLSASAFQVAGAYATLGANTFNATQTVSSGDVSIGAGNLDLPQTTSATRGVITMGGYPFLHACCTLFYNTFLGSGAGNFTMTGTGNTAVGNSALISDTSGFSNSAFGSETLTSNTTGTYNTAAGLGALYTNTTGNSNVANGFDALQNNTTGSQNVGVGYYAGFNSNLAATTGSNNTFVGYSANPGTQKAPTNVTAIGASSLVTATNATAIGANAEADTSNALVLGSINGVNGATASTNVGIGTTSPAATLDVHGTGNFTGLITFASGQTFPGTGTITGVTAGTALTGGGSSGGVTLNVDTTKVVTGVVAGTGLTGGGTGGAQTLNLDTTKVPLLASSNTFTGNQTVNGNLTATGVVTGSGFQIGSNLFDYGSYANTNAFLGFAGNTTMTGGGNTASGVAALASNTSGFNNTASGTDALDFNTGGVDNTASGVQALLFNTTGNYNTASGVGGLLDNTTGTSNTANGLDSLYENTTGNYNTATGFDSGLTLDFTPMTASNNTFLGTSTSASTGTISNATAIGANAEVAQSNALVLGSISGVNFAGADTAVGIGTTTPFYAPLAGSPPTKLNIVGNNTYVPLVVQSPSTFGTWIALDNTSSGGKPWAILSAASGNAEGSGNLGITDFGAGGTIYLEGNVQVTGNLSKAGGSFKIDHPLDPANKYLSHSFVESPDMMNVYNGNVTTDRRGLAVVTLPDYFEALNRDFRYQLTVIGQFAQAIVAKKIAANRFVIRTSKPNVEVSWQVTGIRHDAFADAHRIPNEEDKPQHERGRYLHPELFGASPEQAIGMRPLPVSQEGEIETTQASRKPR